MSGLLGFGVKADRFGELPFLAIGGGQSRIQIKVIGIQLESPLALDDCIINAVVSQISGGGNIADDGRYRIQVPSFEDKLKPFFQLASAERQQREEEVSWCRVGIELEGSLQFC